MKIAIAGSSGFIGKYLSSFLLKSENEIIKISRKDLESGSNHVAKLIKSANVVINLAGAPVLQRWTKKNQKQILSSRVDTTRILAAAVLYNLPDSRPLFINASAIGIYKIGQTHTEMSKHFGNDFLSDVCQKWEHEAKVLGNSAIRLIIMRLGIVLGKEGGTLKTMLPIFKIGLGGRLGSGEQPFSFIHIEDLCRGIEHLINNQQSEGLYNLVGPHVVTNQVFTKTISHILHRPAFFAVPTFILKVIYGKASDIICKGSTVIPEHLLKEGFEFKFPEISLALNDLLNKS